MSDCLIIVSAPFIGGQSAITGLLVLILTLLIFFINRRCCHKPQNFMRQASASVVASRKMIERSAGLHCDFVCRQFLIERIFYYDLPVFDFSFPFHSFPVLSVVLSREQAQQMSTHLPLATFAASIGKWYPFRKIPILTLCAGRGFSLVGSFPNPFTSSHSISRLTNGFCCGLPFTIYNTRKS